MSVFKRKGSPYYQYRFRYNGRDYRASTGTKIREEAELIEANLKRKLWKQCELGVKNPHPWAKALEKFLHTKKNLSTIDDYIFTFTVLTEGFNKFNTSMNLEDITREIVEDIFDEYQDERECSDVRINRMSSHLRCLLNLAANEWGWLDHAPKLRFYKEIDKEPRWLSTIEAKDLINFAPKHLQDPIRFSLLTGVRKANCLGLQWSWINRENKIIQIPSASTKTKKVISIPITDDINAIIMRNLGIHELYVFTYAGKSFKQVMTETWKNILVKAGIKDFRWHDLRHTWASWHVMNGTSLSELMELAGWSSYSMVKRYAHMNADHLRKAAGNISINEGFGEVLEFKNKSK